LRGSGAGAEVGANDVILLIRVVPDPVVLGTFDGVGFSSVEATGGRSIRGGRNRIDIKAVAPGLYGVLTVSFIKTYEVVGLGFSW
jgi:hypothetical protein